MHRLNWYLKRLRVMSWREVIHRIAEQAALWRLRWRGPAPLQGLPGPSAFRFCRASEPQLPDVPFDVRSLEQNKSALLDGRCKIYDFPWRWEPGVAVWHLAPDTGRLWPRTFFASIPYREGNPVGDVRKLWEISRLQHLVDLGVIAHTGTADERRRAVELIHSQVESWHAENPPYSGPHYISAMECALRIMSLCHALDLIRKDIEAEAIWRTLLSIVLSHATLIEQRLSLYSSAGNHLLSEAVGLIYAGVLFPELSQARRWREQGVAILAKESGRQILPDGGPIEQAFGYHRYNLQLFTLTEALLRRYQIDVPQNLTNAVKRGLHFLASVAPPNHDFPYVGDSDSGHALSRYHVLDGGEAMQGPIETFTESGYTIAEIASSPSIRMIFDHGPLGMPPGYGHGHADALSVLLSTEDGALLVDAGTYTYTGEQRWRQYFRSTRAHNTVTIDSQDQAVQDGCFLWARPYQCTLLGGEFNEGHSGRLLAQHDGYRRHGIRHARGVAWNYGKWLLIWDLIDGEGQHLMELHWHLGQSASPAGAHALRLSVLNCPTAIKFYGGDVSSHRGEEHPILGWHSPHYGARNPITTIKVSASGSLPHEFRTLVTFDSDATQDQEVDRAIQWMRARSAQSG